ncbi:hypothetical protein OG203_10575 [Nocardia sp. NBC_01499]|uniref:hypothetical protein n=1 Tax=Nocardia sp. NBC_01499 TaxID=2903597 RepID=UPI00386406B4
MFTTFHHGRGPGPGNWYIEAERGVEEFLALGAHHRTVSRAGLGLFDVVLDTVGTDLRTVRRTLEPGGRMVTIAIDLTRLADSLGYIAA